MNPALRLPFARVTRSRRALLPVLAWLALAVGDAVARRHHLATHAADHALLDVFGAIALPLLAYSVVGGMLGGSGLVRATRPLVSFGAQPVAAALGAIAAAVLASTVLGGIAGALVVAVAHGAGDPPLAQDAITTAWIAGLGGAAYAALFTLGSAFSARGIGRPIVLALDWILGAGTAAGAVVTPRAHLRNLLGGAPPLELSQKMSAACLLLMTIVFIACAALRARRAPV
jgi:hypothetical protein